MSISQMILAANWLIDKDLIQKLNAFIRNKVALSFSLLFFVHTVWLANTINFEYAMLDLRIKSPILILAIIFSTTPSLTIKEFKTVLVFHVLSVLLMSMIGFYIYYFENPTDFRDISPFISHIRLSLNVCIAIFTLVYFIFHTQDIFFKTKYILFASKFVILSLIFWFLNFLSLLQSATGIFLFIFVGLVLILKYIIQKEISKKSKITLLSLILLIPLFLVGFIYISFKTYMYRPPVNIESLEKTTPYGETYRHDTIFFTTENQQWIGLYLCESELEKAWNLRSNMKYNSKDERGNIINYTLIRYLTSMNLRKDRDGVNALSKEDISNIEKGIANKNYTRGIGIKHRLHKLYWEYLMNKTNGDIKGHSMFQRLELWKTSVEILKKNWLFGAGTGDVPDVFKQELMEKNSPLKETRMRSHNQYLSLFIAFGIFGFLLCLFSFIYPFFKTKQFFDYFCMVFLIVFFVSMITEDTIESQDGVTFYAFFSSLYLFLKPLNREQFNNKTND